MDATSRQVIEGLQALRGVAKLTAVAVVAELGRLDRFASPAELMSYCGMVSSEHSSGGPGKAQRGGITKTGNGHLRRLMVESAWAYRHQPAVRGKLQARQKLVGAASVAISWKAQKRLHEKYRRMRARGKEPQKVVVAVGRELLGFVWDVARTIERAAAGVKR
jgi:transposase